NATSWELDLDAKFSAAVGVDELDGKFHKVGIGIGDVLLAFRIDPLLKIALAIQEAEADERDPHVARRLATVAGEDAETARVDRQAFVKTEFGAEIREPVIGREPSQRTTSRALGAIGRGGR